MKGNKALETLNEKKQAVLENHIDLLKKENEALNNKCVTLKNKYDASENQNVALKEENVALQGKYVLLEKKHDAYIELYDKKFYC